MIAKLVLSIAGLIVTISGTLGNMVDRDVEKYRQNRIEEPCRRVDDDEVSLDLTTPRTTKPSKIPFESQSHNESHRTRRRR